MYDITTLADGDGLATNSNFDATENRFQRNMHGSLYLRFVIL
jgi:hypothetical protein